MVVARSREPLQKLKDEYSKQVEILNGDLADFSLAQQAVDLALKSFGRLDGMVLNHGILGQVGKIADADPEQWKQGFDVNFVSLVAFVRFRLVVRRGLGACWTDQHNRSKPVFLRCGSPRVRSSSPRLARRCRRTVAGVSTGRPRPL